MPNKVLFLSTIAIFSRFNLPFMRWFRQQGWQVDYVSDGEIQIPDCDNQYAIPIKRSPFNLKNIQAYRELKKILLTNDYDIIHCHTPMGGVLGRLAAKNGRVRAKIIYTAHGFHFYKGAPFINWILYYPIEKYLAKFTDILVTINEEDYCIAKKKFNKCQDVCKVDGVGVDLTKFKRHDLSVKLKMRNELGYKGEDFIITNVAEINKNKNQKMLITSVPYLKKNIPNLKILFIGNDNYSKTKPKLERLVRKLKLQDTVYFLGYRHDIDKLTAISDIAFSASKREGLPVNIIEAMASGIPVVCSKNRGHNSLITDNVSGLLFSNTSEMQRCILKVYSSVDLASLLQNNASIQATKYSQSTAINNMSEIYRQCMRDLN